MNSTEANNRGEADVADSNSLQPVSNGTQRVTGESEDQTNVTQSPTTPDTTEQ